MAKKTIVKKAKSTVSIKKAVKVENKSVKTAKADSSGISASTIAKLREMTGAGIMDCKKALEATNGDFDAAIKVIQEKGALIAEKKSARQTGTGFLESYIHNGRVGVLLEIRCETDFAANSEPFKVFAKDVAMQVAAMNPDTVPVLMKQVFIKDQNLTVEKLLNNLITKIGENIKIEKFVRYEI